MENFGKKVYLLPKSCIFLPKSIEKGKFTEISKFVKKENVKKRLKKRGFHFIKMKNIFENQFKFFSKIYVCIKIFLTL